MIRLGTVTVCVVLLATSCIGSITREQFDERVRDRGGGLSGQLALDGVAAVEDRLDGTPVEVVAITVDPGQVHIQTRVPGTEGDVDGWFFGSSGLYGGRGLRGPEPVPSPPVGASLDARTFAPERAGLERLGEMVDRALDETGLAGGYASQATVGRGPGDDGPMTRITVTDDRRMLIAVFGPRGGLRTVGES